MVKLLTEVRSAAKKRWPGQRTIIWAAMLSHPSTEDPNASNVWRGYVIGRDSKIILAVSPIADSHDGCLSLLKDSVTSVKNVAGD